MSAVRAIQTNRRARLFSIACCRNIWHLFEDSCCREAVLVADWFIDGKAHSVQLREVRRRVQAIGGPRADPGDQAALSVVRMWDGANAVWHATAKMPRITAVCGAMRRVLANFAWEQAGHCGIEVTVAQQSASELLAEFLRDIFGNPFRPVWVHPDSLTWNDGTVPKLAQTIYDDRRFDLLPILADALEEAGCDHADVLAHCRGSGSHVRGCWVVDLLLGKL
jgi:hypothetical protein